MEEFKTNNDSKKEQDMSRILELEAAFEAETDTEKKKILQTELDDLRSKLLMSKATGAEKLIIKASVNMLKKNVPDGFRVLERAEDYKKMEYPEWVKNKPKGIREKIAYKAKWMKLSRELDKDRKNGMKYDDEHYIWEYDNAIKKFRSAMDYGRKMTKTLGITATDYVMLVQKNSKLKTRSKTADKLCFPTKFSLEESYRYLDDEMVKWTYEYKDIVKHCEKNKECDFFRLLNELKEANIPDLALKFGTEEDLIRSAYQVVKEETSYTLIDEAPADEALDLINDRVMFFDFKNNRCATPEMLLLGFGWDDGTVYIEEGNMKYHSADTMTFINKRKMRLFRNPDRHYRDLFFEWSGRTDV